MYVCICVRKGRQEGALYEPVGGAFCELTHASPSGTLEGLRTQTHFVFVWDTQLRNQAIHNTTRTTRQIDPSYKYFQLYFGYLYKKIGEFTLPPPDAIPRVFLTKFCTYIVARHIYGTNVTSVIIIFISETCP